MKSFKMKPQTSTYTRINQAKWFHSVWGLTHNHNRVNKPLCILSSKCRVHAPWSK